MRYMEIAAVIATRSVDILFEFRNQSPRPPVEVVGKGKADILRSSNPTN